MKLLSRFLTLLAFAATLTLLTTSCDNDTCFECNEHSFEDGGVTLTVDAFSVCEGDDNGSGGSITREEIDIAIAFHEATGGICTEN